MIQYWVYVYGHFIVEYAVVFLDYLIFLIL